MWRNHWRSQRLGPQRVRRGRSFEAGCGPADLSESSDSTRLTHECASIHHNVAFPLGIAFMQGRNWLLEVFVDDEYELEFRRRRKFSP